MAIRAVIFDLGGVVMDSPFESIARYERAAGLPAGLVKRLNATDPDTNAWAHYERGDVDAAGFCELFEAEALAQGHRIDARAVIAALDGEIRPAVLRAVTLIHQAGLRTAACTNNVAPLDRSAPKVEQMLRPFDVIVQSSVEGIRKPEPAIYEITLDRLGVAAQECAFLDDLGVNLKPARAMGLATIKVGDPAVALDELGRLVGIELSG